MAFDAGLLWAITRELNLKLGEDNGFGSSRIDKILMPEKDEIHLLLHVGRENVRLVISASSNNPRIHITDTTKENPVTPPTFCMLLRKHLLSGKISCIRQLGFERVCELEFDFRNELGDLTKKYLVHEIMGKHSNIILLDKDRKILGAIRTNDLSLSTKRPLIPGIKYELPPKQEKLDPTCLEKEHFLKVFENSDPTALCEKVITSNFLGISPLVSREIVYQTTRDCTSLVKDVEYELLWQNFSRVFSLLKEGKITPTLIYRQETPDTPFEYTFIDIKQYENKGIVTHPDTVSEVIDTFFTTRDKNERIKQRSQDIFHLLLKSQSRLLKKVELQEGELLESETMDFCRKCGDLISQEMYRIKRGDKTLVATDYTQEGYPEVVVELDDRLSPSQNAQRYYKKYNRKKNAHIEITKQIAEAKEELKYIDAVLDSLSRATTEADLDELREELSMWGYGKRDKKKLKTAEKKKKIKPLKAISPSGLEVYIGKNNLQNDYITTKLSSKNDWWFHVKNFAGSHVLLKTAGEEPPSEDFTFAASLAAMHSSSKGENIAVDYTLIKHVKKPPSSKPGFVTYSTYWTAYVTPDKKELEKAIIKN
ncbi:MAG: fibronectin/fibrinogen-binding protein [Ruminococcaceae bacterium]|nr:fibronectin/fibrinogen-binding protein [Oscillospiraceae bacterium]